MPPKLQELRDEAVKIDSQLQSLATKKTQLMKDLDKYIRDGSAVEKEIRDLEKAFSHALLCCAMMEHPDGKPLLHTLKDMRQTRAQTIGEHQTIITRIQEIQNEELNEAVSKVQEQSTKLQSEKNANESIKQKQDEKLSYLESVLNKSKAESEQQTTQVQTFSMAMMQTQEELQKARDTVCVALLVQAIGPGIAVLRRHSASSLHCFSQKLDTTNQHM
eukprot:m.1298130 g.1298130  ORF g.1298130 m.1298130 type:complete len:218 (-) comp24798_c1_seq55:1078-1731(-)